ncbi:hypothetical protein NDU88_002131 [Pleurodeles waltl]|uniref:Uncharacterized protein n=1 Tax=Pleurodeles waltl TaxID=8319 RepID=A0AAV7UXG2_PLEWA|nr:hypothetical protein NDU88_002131 [Pleurodeles waltl]
MRNFGAGIVTYIPRRGLEVSEVLIPRRRLLPHAVELPSVIDLLDCGPGEAQRNCWLNPIEHRGCLLAWGLLPTRAHKVGNRFLDLALALDWCRIALMWKSQTGPPIESWDQDVTTWATAEETVLRGEDARGIWRRPVAPLWMQELERWEYPDQDLDQELTDEDVGDGQQDGRT